MRAPASKTFSHASDDSVVAGAYHWSTLQSDRVSGDFTSQNWRDHTSTAGTISYHLFSFIVSLSTHKVMQDEISALRVRDKERQGEVSRLVTQITKLQYRK